MQSTGQRCEQPCLGNTPVLEETGGKRSWSSGRGQRQEVAPLSSLGGSDYTLLCQQQKINFLLSDFLSRSSQSLLEPFLF